MTKEERIDKLLNDVAELKMKITEGKIRETSLKQDIKRLQKVANNSSKIILKMAIEIKQLKNEKGALAAELHKEIDYSEELQKRLDRINEQ